jgi:hypothetical protein
MAEEKSPRTGNKMQASSDMRQVLLVAAPNDPQAGELVTGLRASGVNVLVANTIALASRADEFAICIIILRPGQWRTTPVITTAMRSNPPYMIPVLAEPMPLPSAAWSTEAVNVKDPLSETVEELKVLIHKQLQISSEGAHKDQEQQTKNNFRRHQASPIFRSITYNNPRMRVSPVRRRYVAIGLLLILISGIGFYYATRNMPALPSTNILSGGGPIPHSVFGQSYTVTVPGGCNVADKDWWSVGSHFKTLGTPTPTSVNTKTSPKETPTPYVVMDNSTMIKCRQDGLYVQRTDNHYDYYSEVFFQGNGNEALPQHFSTQVTATALNPSNAATFSFGVRQQLNGDGYDRGYGNDDLDVSVNGNWRTMRINDVTDQKDTTFTSGYVTPSSEVTLGAEVDGPRITFSINGKTVTTLVDTTYPHGYSIRFGLTDGEAKSPPSALYSNFSYKPLANTNLTQRVAVATATAQASQNMHTPYTATIPGFGCDQGQGQWGPVTKDNNHITANCQSNGLAVSQNPSSPYAGYVSFYGVDGNLPTNYQIQVHIDTSELADDGCAGLMTRMDQAAGYNFVVCPNGYWNIQRYDNTDRKWHKLAEDFVNAQTSYTMLATSQGDAQTLALDGNTLTTVHDSTLRTTDHIRLTMFAGQDTAGTAIFSKFIFTPLP